MVAAQAYWKEIGVDAINIPVDGGTLRMHRQTKTSDELIGKMTIESSGLVRAGTIDAMNSLYHSTSARSLFDGSELESRYDALARQAMSADPFTDWQYLEEMTDLILDDSLTIGIIATPSAYAAGPRVDVSDVFMPFYHMSTQYANMKYTGIEP